jgi:DNA-binding beta-propeller fold protein YncE
VVSRVPRISFLLLAVAVLLAFASSDARAQTPVAIPGGAGGIGFDDLKFAPSLGKILAPAGRAGRIALVDPGTRSVSAIEGFSAKKEYGGGHDDGVTSADEGKGWIFATDRTSLLLDVVDPASAKIVSSAKLSGSPDYVRFVETTGEVWVTEPEKERIEIFRLSDARPPVPAHEAFVAVPGGPESLVVDAKSGRAYTHLWKGKTSVLDIQKRTISATWDNGCTGSRGIALDPARGLLFAGCAEGKAVVLEAATGKEISSFSAGNGVDIIDYDSKSSHLYLPGGRSATMAILTVSPAGKLSRLGEVKTAPRAHCVATDGNGNVFVCDPDGGRLLYFRDSFR